MTRAKQTALRVALIFDALVFLTAAALNFGARIPLGFVTVLFPVHILPAGVGEAVIGGVLLAAGVTGRRGLSWLAFWLSAGGIAFGLIATSARRGPAWDVHLILVPLAAIVLGLLVWTGRGMVGNATRAVVRPPRAIIGLTILTACTLLVAAGIHFGPHVPLGFATLYDPSRSAAIPETVLGVLLALGAAFLISGRPGSREMATAAAIFTFVLSLYGLSGMLSAGRMGDAIYHIALLAMLTVIIVGLLVSRRRPAREGFASP